MFDEPLKNDRAFLIAAGLRKGDDLKRTALERGDRDVKKFDTYYIRKDRRFAQGTDIDRHRHRILQHWNGYEDKNLLLLHGLCNF
jgi:hypothetical protein